MLARFMNGARKIVFSRSLQDASAWANSEVAAQNLTQTIASEKTKAGKDMVIFAGAKFAGTVIRERLVDEYWLLTIPMLFGGGSRLFDASGGSQKLILLEARPMDTGAVLNRYATMSV
jgi:dihydrofolate reductase